MVAMRVDVKLPERTRARFEEESAVQRAQKPHDIRNMIPRIDSTDPAKFPVYQFREFPKMPLLNGNRPIVIDDSGGVLVFYTRDDEDEFMEMNPEIADEIRANSPEVQATSALVAAQDEISELRAKLLAAGIEVPEKKAKAAANKLGALTGGATPSEPVKVAEDVGAQSDDLKSKLLAVENAQASAGGNPLKPKPK